MQAPLLSGGGSPPGLRPEPHKEPLFEKSSSLTSPKTLLYWCAQTLYFLRGFPAFLRALPAKNFIILVCTVFKACTNRAANRAAVQVQPARLGVGVYRGGGIETPAPIPLLWLLSLCKESNIKKKSK